MIDSVVHEKPAKVLLQESSCEALFCLESGSKQWKAIWWTTKPDTLQYLEIHLVHSCLCAKLGIVPFFPNSRQSPNDTRSDTLAIPFWYMNAHAQEEKSRDVLHTWPALSENPKYEPAIMNTDNFNYLWLTYVPYHTYMPTKTQFSRYRELRIAIPKPKRAPWDHIEFCLPLTCSSSHQGRDAGSFTHAFQRD